eukprot:11434028-Alexandrium_andersonii.AAC.1
MKAGIDGPKVAAKRRTRKLQSASSDPRAAQSSPRHRLPARGWAADSVIIVGPDLTTNKPPTASRVHCCTLLRITLRSSNRFCEMQTRHTRLR